MSSLLQSIADHHATILLILTGLSVGLLVVLFRLSASLRELRGRWSGLLDGTSGKNLEMLLHDHLRERLGLQAELEQANARIAVLEQKVSTSKRHMGLVRFDAFEDVGGAQSFALALYDDNGNGAVLNGLIGRTDCRVYAKPLISGRSDRTLSQEESRAVEEASSSAPKAVITS